MGHMTAEIYRICKVRSLQLPRVSVLEPVVWLLHLIAVLDLLAENAVVISDSISICRKLKSCKGIHEACGKSSQTSVSKSCVRLCICQLFVTVAKALESILDLLLDSKVDDVICHGPTHEEFQ